MRTLLKNGIIISKDINDTIFDRGWILINKNVIEALGDGDPPQYQQYQIDKTIDLNGNIVLPGFINCHTHFSQALIKGLSENLNLEEWLNKIVRPLQRDLSFKEMELATLLSVSENLHSGVTTVIQHHKLTNPEYINLVLDIVAKLDIRLVMMIGCNNTIARYHKGVESLIDFIVMQSKSISSDHTKIGFGITSLENSSKELLLKISDASNQNEIPKHIHIAETESERKECIKKNNLPPVEYLNQLEFLNSLTQLVHCVWVDENEINLIKQLGSHIIHCPISNFYLRAGSAKIDKMLTQNISVVLGSDGSGSSTSQDILNNLRIVTLLLKSSGVESTIASASNVLNMVTRWAANMLGRNDLGQLIIGAEADMVVFDINDIHMQPMYDPQISVVFNASSKNIKMVFVAGECVLDSGKLVKIDESKLIAEAKRFVPLNKNRWNYEKNI